MKNVLIGLSICVLGSLTLQAKSTLTAQEIKSIYKSGGTVVCKSDYYKVKDFEINKKSYYNVMALGDKVIAMPNKGYKDYGQMYLNGKSKFSCYKKD